MTSLTTSKHEHTRQNPRSGGLVRERFSVGAFTLIELMTVIVIIAILVALLFPAIKTVLLKAEVNQAKGDVKAIENAIASYRNEYGKVPTQTSDQGGSDQFYNAGNAFQIYNALRAVASGWNAADALNPRRIAFLETPARKGAFDSNGNFLDPWGATYVIALDCDYNGTITAGIFTNKAGPAVVFSYGPDRVSTNATTAADDIANYQ